MCGRNVRNIETFHHRRRHWQQERIPERLQIGFRIQRGRQRSTSETSCRFGRALEIIQHVSQLRRSLELQIFRRLLHLLFELIQQFSTLALQKAASFQDARPVMIQADLANAGSTAVFDDVIQAPFVIDLAWFEGPARPDAKPFANPIQRDPQRPGMRERPKVPRSIIFSQTSERKTRDRVVQVHFHQQKALVVPEADVVLRPVFLD